METLELFPQLPLKLPLLLEFDELMEPQEAINEWWNEISSMPDEKQKKRMLKELAPHLRLTLRTMSVVLKRSVKGVPQGAFGRREASKFLGEVFQVARQVSRSPHRPSALLILTVYSVGPRQRPL